MLHTTRCCLDIDSGQALEGKAIELVTSVCGDRSFSRVWRMGRVFIVRRSTLIDGLRPGASFIYRNLDLEMKFGEGRTRPGPWVMLL